MRNCEWPTCSSTRRPSRVIDFDDYGLDWFFYDFSTTVSFMEDDPALSEWQKAWVTDYRSRRPIAAADEDMLASFVLLRRLILLAWMGTQPFQGIPH